MDTEGSGVVAQLPVGRQASQQQEQQLQYPSHALLDVVAQLHQPDALIQYPVGLGPVDPPGDAVSWTGSRQSRPRSSTRPADSAGLSHAPHLVPAVGGHRNAGGRVYHAAGPLIAAPYPVFFSPMAASESLVDAGLQGDGVSEGVFGVDVLVIELDSKC